MLLFLFKKKYVWKYIITFPLFSYRKKPMKKEKIRCNGYQVSNKYKLQILKHEI